MNLLIQFFQNRFPLKVKRMISKFIVSNSEEIVYIGTICLILEKGRELYNFESNTVESYDFLNKIKRRRKTAHNFMKYDPPSETIKIFSDNLFSRLVVEECKGDFCKYDFLENLKGCLQVKIHEYQGQKDLNCTHKLLGSIYSVKMFF